MPLQAKHVPVEMLEATIEEVFFLFFFGGGGVRAVML
jgi:hypothetical protein